MGATRPDTAWVAVTIVWLNGTVGSGKTAVGRALAELMPCARFLDGDDYAGPSWLPKPESWRLALKTLLRMVARRGRVGTLVIAYPLDRTGYRRLQAACSRARQRLLVVTLAPPLAMTLRGRGGRQLDPGEQARVREMRSQGYHRRRFARATLVNAHQPASRTAVTFVHAHLYR